MKIIIFHVVRIPNALLLTQLQNCEFPVNLKVKTVGTGRNVQIKFCVPIRIINLTKQLKQHSIGSKELNKDFSIRLIVMLKSFKILRYLKGYTINWKWVYRNENLAVVKHLKVKKGWKKTTIVSRSFTKLFSLVYVIFIFAF